MAVQDRPGSTPSPVELHLRLVEDEVEVERLQQVFCWNWRRYRSLRLSSFLLLSFRLNWLSPYGGSLVCTLVQICCWHLLPQRQSILLLNSRGVELPAPQPSVAVHSVREPLMAHQESLGSYWQPEAADPCALLPWPSGRSP